MLTFNPLSLCGYPPFQSMKTQLKTPWIPHINPNDTVNLRLFCFPYAGGSSLSFRSWRDRLPDTIGIYPIELPGRGLRIQESPMATLHPLIYKLAPSLSPFLDKPFAFFGHSMGAVIAFELTRYLRKQRQPQPVRLCVSGRCAPQVPPITPPIHNLPEPEFLAALRHLNGTPKEVFENPELLALALPILRADFSVVETYTYTDDDPLQCPISVFGGREDPETTIAFLEAWKLQTTETMALHLFAGDHFFIHSHFDELLAVLKQDLSR